MQLHGSHGVEVFVLNLLQRSYLKFIGGNFSEVQLEFVLFSNSQPVFSFDIALDYVILNDSLNILYRIWSRYPSWLLAHGRLVLEAKGLLGVLVGQGVLVSVPRDLLGWALKIEEVIVTEAAMSGKASEPAKVCATDSRGLRLTAMELGYAGRGCCIA